VPLRNARPLTIRPVGLTDSQDGSNSFPGGMASLQNLVPSPTTRSIMVPRPASTQITDFESFSGPQQGEALLIVGTKYYGLIASARFLGHSEPFLYDSSTNAFIALQGVTVANTPLTQPTTGDWVPPQIAQVGARVIVTSPGFPGGGLNGAFFGWFDITGFAYTNAVTGTTPGDMNINALSINVLQAGWAPGQFIAGADIPVGSRIVSIAADGLSLTIDNNLTVIGATTITSVTGGNTAAPLWCAGNTTPFALPSVPIAIAQFSGRAWYGLNTPTSGGDDLGTVIFSDAGAPLLITNALAVQVITFQNGLHVTALAGLPLNNQLGGIIQSLMVFQGAGNIQQITGDQSTSNLSVNSLNEAVGTLAPNSIAPTPMGLMFMAPDGLRIINFQANVSPPIGMNGDGLAFPFVNAVYPSRMAAAYNEDVYRCSVYGNVSAGGIEFDSAMWQEFWYHVKLKSWSGTHTFPAAIIKASQDSLGFVLFPVGLTPIGLWFSNTLPRLGSTYVENGLTLQCTYQTVLEPDNELMAENCVVQSNIMLGLPFGMIALVHVIDDDRVILDNTYLLGVGPPSSQWGTMIWGSGTWGALTGVLKQRKLNWQKPLVFKQAALVVTVQAATGVAIGNFYMNYAPQGYSLAIQPISSSYLLDDNLVPILDPATGEPILVPTT
jgi:hypothetical protein